MSNVHQFPARNKPQMQCLGCGTISESPCDCGVGWKAIVDEYEAREAEKTERNRAGSRERMRKKRQQDQRPVTRNISRRRKAASSAEANDFIRELLEFTADYSARLTAWHEANPDMDSEDKSAMMRTIHQCADTVLGLAQAIDGR